MPETSILLKPRINFRQGLSSDSARPPLGVAAPSHETSRFEDADMLGNGARRHLERLSEFSNRRVAFHEPLENGASRWIGERRERCAELVAHHFGTVLFRNQLVL